jgi:hypothetical protein
MPIEQQSQQQQQDSKMLRGSNASMQLTARAGSKQQEAQPQEV